MFEAFIAATLIAALSLTGAFLFKDSGHISGTHRFIVPLALGMFLAVVFFELVPETLHQNEKLGPVAIVFGFLGFYLLSHILRSYHSHSHEECDDCLPPHSAQLVLIGDAFHNFADGIVIATAFVINPTIGIATAVGIALHEIPQEIAEYGVLISAGYSKMKAALMNLLSASSIILGVGVTFALMNAGDFLWILTGIAAGNLLYIAASDMIPELHGRHHRHFVYTFASTLIGLILIAGIIMWTHGEAGHGDHGHSEALPEDEHNENEDHGDHSHDEELHEDEHNESESEDHGVSGSHLEADHDEHDLEEHEEGHDAH